MAFTQTNTGGYIINKFDDVMADFPTDGIKVGGVTSMLIDATAVAVDVYYTFDTYASIDAGTATYVKIKTVALGSTDFTEFAALSPTGIKLEASAAGGKAWIAT